MQNKSRKYNNITILISSFAILFGMISCTSDESELTTVNNQSTENDDGNVVLGNEDPVSILSNYFNETLNLERLQNYENQIVPNYIIKDNTGDNEITNAKATLGRVLFYDKKLSSNNTISCASCHKQAFAFGDTDIVSQGVNGTTGRHSMRLINTRFSDEVRFFWDERAVSLEGQTTQPIQDHLEMGFSGLDGAPSLNDLILKLNALDYYQELVNFAYGDMVITENRIQESLAQFIRSIQSFDSKYDRGRANAVNEGQDFSNFTTQENLGKQLFLSPPNMGGVGCAGCHRVPEFDIDPNSRNNGVIGVFGTNEIDVSVTRAPTLRDIFNASGTLNGALMHDASKTTMRQVLEHYNAIDPTGNTDLDRRLRGGPGENGQRLNLSDDQMLALEAFIKTLSGSDVYTNEKWSDPFL
ncbi:cytochrome-c peroxidase [Aquimarina agarilytica]|uniref:cytochrome-c peroxidase n=1 Tax=Aquimarina agarilytica TaxID=1087449 RepID=UPI000289A617|nr:cytochrome-c peroxidase [Aquimarina agarilytica]